MGIGWISGGLGLEGSESMDGIMVKEGRGLNCGGAFLKPKGIFLKWPEGSWCNGYHTGSVTLFIVVVGSAAVEEIICNFYVTWGSVLTMGQSGNRVCVWGITFF